MKNAKQCKCSTCGGTGKVSNSKQESGMEINHKKKIMEKVIINRVMVIQTQRIVLPVMERVHKDKL